MDEALMRPSRQGGPGGRPAVTAESLQLPGEIGEEGFRPGLEIAMVSREEEEVEALGGLHAPPSKVLFRNARVVPTTQRRDGNRERLCDPFLVGLEGMKVGLQYPQGRAHEIRIPFDLGWKASVPQPNQPEELFILQKMLWGLFPRDGRRRDGGNKEVKRKRLSPLQEVVGQLVPDPPPHTVPEEDQRLRLDLLESVCDGLHVVLEPGRNGFGVSAFPARRHD
jgi:hypothetical protein